MSGFPHQLQLTGADYFILALDRQMRQGGMPGNVCRLVLDLDGALEAKALRAVVAQSETLNWIASLRMIRWLPFMSPRWRTNGARGGLPVALRAGEAGAGGREEFNRPLGEIRTGKAPGLNLELIGRPDGSTRLVLAWHHALMDVRGAEFLVRHIQDRAAGGAAVGTVAFNPDQTRTGPLDFWRGFPARVRFGRESLAFITQACRPPLASLALAQGPPAAARNQFRILRFSAEETRRMDEQVVRLNASFRRGMFYLAASIRALNAVFRRRGRPPESVLVPVPHDLRKRGMAGPIFSNQVSFLFFRVEAEALGGLGEMTADLGAQMMEQIRRRTPESFATVMELFRPLPLGFYARRIKQPTQGRFATFFFSDIGESLAGMETFLGLPVREVTHLAPAGGPPGLTVIFSRHRGRQSVVLSLVEGCLDEPELELFEQALRRDLLSEAKA